MNIYFLLHFLTNISKVRQLMFAIIEVGGRQYKVKETDVLNVEKVDAAENSSMSVDKVLLLSDNKTTRIGSPYVDGASVELKVKKTAKAKKVIIFKMKAKKRYKRLKGHRQMFSEVEVLKING